MPRRRSSATAAVRPFRRRRPPPVPRWPAPSAARKTPRTPSSAPTAANHSPAEAPRRNRELAPATRPRRADGAGTRADEPVARLGAGRRWQPLQRWWWRGLQRRGGGLWRGGRGAWGGGDWG